MALSTQKQAPSSPPISLLVNKGQNTFLPTSKATHTAAEEPSLRLRFLSGDFRIPDLTTEEGVCMEFPTALPSASGAHQNIPFLCGWLDMYQLSAQPVALRGAPSPGSGTAK